jgi:hypothetical protein
MTNENEGRAAVMDNLAAVQRLFIAAVIASGGTLKIPIDAIVRADNASIEMYEDIEGRSVVYTVKE